MRKTTGVLLAVLAVLLLTATSAFASRTRYFPRHHQCRAGYHRERVMVRERRDGHWRRVRRVACVRIRYRASVDPTFTQSVTNPLAVTYQYSAGAFAGNTNLASTGTLPAGVLNFYSAQTPGGPESLFCSMDVGGFTAAGSCPVTYGQTGAYSVTTQYLPDSVSAVTETDVETISPFATTTTLTATEGTCSSGSPPGYLMVPGPYCSYTLANSVIDQNGNPVGSVVVLSAPLAPGGAQGSYISANGSCGLYVTSSWVLSPACNFEVGSGLDDVGAWPLTAAFPGIPGWAPSQAASPVTVSP